MKKLIRLTENDLRGIIKRSVNRILREAEGDEDLDYNGFYDSLKTYLDNPVDVMKGDYEPSADDINAVSSAKVVASDFGHSVCFVLKNGGMKFMPVSNTSKANTAVGDTVDLSKCQVVTLSREGDADIQRIEING